MNEASDTTMQQALQPTQDRDWLLVEQGYDPRRERSIESRFTVLLGVQIGILALLARSAGAPASAG